MEKNSGKPASSNSRQSSGRIHGDWESFAGSANPAMQLYLRELGTFPKLSPEEQSDLAARILAAENKWRRVLYNFAFTAQWQIDYLDTRDHGQWRDCFAPSSLSGENDAAYIQVWLERVGTLLRQLQQAFAEGNESAILMCRENLSAELMRCKFSCDILMECHEQLHTTAFAPIPGKMQINADESCMSQDEFLQYLRQADDARTELYDLRQKMVEGNLRLVVRIVNQYNNRQFAVSDLVQEGNLGLMRALEKFDFNLKNKFSTYASYWIRQSIGRALAEQFRVIRIPAHMVSTIAAINRVEQRFIMEHDRLPESDEIAALLEMPVARVSAIRQMARQPISLQSPLGSDSTGNSLEDLLPDERTVDPAQDVAEESAQEQLLKLLSKLTDRERDVLTMRFGLMGHPVCTLQEISKHFNISRERVRQLEMQTLNKLRSQETLRFFDKNNLD